MEFNNRVKSRIVTPKLAAVCKHCHRGGAFGRIRCNLEIELASFTTPKDVDIHPHMLFPEPHYNIPQTFLGDQLIEVACPECGKDAMLVDAEMGELVSCFNQLGVYTRWSCSGHGDCGMYIGCFDPMPLGLQDLFRRCEGTTVENEGRNIYLTIDDADGEPTHCAIEEEARRIREKWMKVLIKWNELQEAHDYHDQQVAKWKNLQARYMECMNPNSDERPKTGFDGDTFTTVPIDN